MPGPKILTTDIETLPLDAHVWGLFDQNVGLSQIKEDWAMLSYAAKFLGSKKVYYGDTRNAQGIRDDKAILAELVALLDEADVVVGHNVRRFDLRKVRARAIMHGLAPFREPAVIDTMEMAKGTGAFTSNKLEYLSKTLLPERYWKSGHSKYPGFEMWAGIMRGEEAAWEEMRKYNIQDIRATEQLYLTLRPWAKRLPNLAQYYADEECRCPRCGSKGLMDFGTVKSNVSEYKQYLCRDCGGFSRSRYTINSKQKRQSLLAV